MAEAFGAMTRRLRTGIGQSMNRTARAAGIDPAYLMRLERDVHQYPRREVVLSLARALDLTPRQTDRYLFAAGLAPVVDWQHRAEDYAARLATIYGAIDGLTLPDVAEAHPFVRRSA